jgi:hypothetical protein
MMKKTISYQFFLLVSFSLASQDVYLKVEYPSFVEAGKQFSIMWTVNSTGGEFSAPPFTGFYKLMGPQTSQSSQTQIINGRMSQQTSSTYLYFLQALNEGKYVINPAVFKLKNKTFTSDSVFIEVTGSSTTAPGTQKGNQQDAAGAVQNAGGDIFINLALNRKDVYVGEHIVATAKLFTKVDISGINEIKYPPFTGFLKTDIDTPPLTSLKQENINGTIYGTGVLQEFLIYPQVTGEITIDPVQLTVLIRQRSGQSDPFFGDFFATYQTLPKAVISQPVKVNVKPLPGTKPADFSGVVGKVSLKAVINKDTVNVNDAITLKIILSGNGNMKIAQAPKLQLSSDIEVYDPKIIDDIKNSAGGTSGQKTFEYLLIPRHYGDFTIPSVTYSYFNTSTGKYEQLTTDEFRFHARRGTGQDPGITVFGGISRSDVRYVGKDIRFIKSLPGRLEKSEDIIVSKRTYYSVYALALFIFFIVLFLRREHVKRNADIAAVRNRKAGRIAVKRLRSAAVCLKNGETDKLHEEILKAIWGYLSDKLNIPVSELNRNNSVESLRNKGVTEEEINELLSILDTCEFARYSPSSSGTGSVSVYEAASRFIKSLENTIV